MNFPRVETQSLFHFLFTGFLSSRLVNKKKISVHFFLFFILDRKSRKIVQWDFETESLAGCSENDHSENNNLIKKFAVIPLLARTAVFGNSTPPTTTELRKKRIRNSLSTYYIYQRKNQY